MEPKSVPQDVVELRTLKEMVDRSVTRYGRELCLALLGGEQFSYSDLGECISGARKELMARGIKPGDKVALLGENRPEWGIAYLSVTSMGAVVVPILPDFSAAEIGSIIEHSEAKALIVSDSLAKKAPEHPTLQFTLSLEELTTFRRPEGSEEDLAPEPREEDLAAILYTSGTTGRPKGVMLTHRNIVQNVIGSRTLVEITPEDRFLSILPLAHTYECTIGFLIPFSSGASVTYLGKPPVLSALLPALKEVRPTMMVSVPLIMEKLYQARIRPMFERNLLTKLLKWVAPLRLIIHRAAGRKVYETFGGALHFFGIGGAPLSSDAERFLREAKFPYAIGYGLTETSPLVAGTDAANTKFRSTGPPILGVDVHLEPDGGEGEGEILVRGPNVMQGYYKDEEATKEVMSADGWFHTGDLGWRDKEGYLYIRGRLKNMIVGSGGENIYPGDIEAVIDEQELVLESVVFDWQGQLIAKVHVDIERLKEQLGDGAEEPGAIQHRADQLLEEIRRAVNSRVSRQSRLSRMVLQWEPFERTPTKKIKRFLYTHLPRRAE
ncbi:MAG: AMP-binding protein [Alkalispirochaetaceae bacterium]